MPIEPVSVVISTASSMVLEKAILVLISQPQTMTPILERIQADTQILRDAPLTDALDCLRESDLEGYKTSLRQAKNRNPFSAHARVLYAAALIREGKTAPATAVFAECIHFYGIGCPLIPEQVRDAYKDQTDIELPGGTPNRTNEMGVVGDWHNSWELKGFAVSAAGIAAAWDQNVGLFTRKMETRIAFQPWAAMGGSAEVELVKKRGEKSRPVCVMTDRFLVHSLSDRSDFEAIDLQNPVDRRDLTHAQATATFGDMTKLTLIKAPAKIRGVELTIGSKTVKIWEPRSWGGYESTTTMPQAIAKPKVGPPLAASDLMALLGSENPR